MRYDIYTLPDGRATVRPTHNGRSTFEQMLREMTMSTTLTRADGLAAVAFITDYMTRQLARGTTVCIEGLGTFGVSLEISGGEGSSRLTGNEVQMKRVTFKAAPSFRQSIAGAMSHIRVDKLMRNSSLLHHSVEERREIVLRMASEMQTFTAEDYHRRSGMSRTASQLDLRRFEGEGVIRSRRIGRTKLYSAAASDAAQRG